MVLKRLTFIISIIAVIYFAYLFTMYFTGTEFPTIAGVIHEMIMLPLLIACPVFFIISIVLVIKEKFNFRSISFYAFLLFLVAITCIILMMKGEVEMEM